MPFAGLLIMLVILLVLLASAVRVLREYERGVIFRLGRLVGSKGTGVDSSHPAHRSHGRSEFANCCYGYPASGCHYKRQCFGESKTF